MDWGASLWAAGLRLLSFVPGLFGGPKVTLEGVHRSPLWESDVRTYDVTQVWFKNRPRATAKDVTAEIEFFDTGAATPHLVAHGQWAVTTAPGHVGFAGFTSATDIPAGHTPVKLLVVLKHTSDNSAYAFAAENIHAYGDGRHPDFELPAGDYRMRVSLAGPNIDVTFWFDVTGGGIGAQPVVTQRGRRKLLGRDVAHWARGRRVCCRARPRW